MQTGGAGTCCQGCFALIDFALHSALNNPGWPDAGLLAVRESLSLFLCWTGPACVLSSQPHASMCLLSPPVQVGFCCPHLVTGCRYVHRVGRTGRAGRTGEAITLVAPEEGAFAEELSASLGERSLAVAAPAVGRMHSTCTLSVALQRSH